MELQGRSEMPPILTVGAECLVLYPYEQWREFEERIVDVSEVEPDAQDYARMVLSGAVEAPIDKQGRILVPTFLREHARLEREVAVAGVGRKVELWNKERLDQNLANTQSRYHEISSAVAKLGS